MDQARRELLRRAIEADHQEREKERLRVQRGFDGLLERIPEGAPPLLARLIRELEHYLIAKYSDERAKYLLAVVMNGMCGGGDHEDWGRIPADDLLVLRLLSIIQLAFGKDEFELQRQLLGDWGFKELARRQAARRPRKPELEQWIDRHLASDATQKSPDLWINLPTCFKDEISYGRFAKRVTARRKIRKTDASK